MTPRRLASPAGRPGAWPLPAGIARLLVVLAACAAGGCSKCGAPTGTPASAHDAGAAVRRAIDLRSAMMAALPEWRGVEIESGRATLLREVDGPFDAAKLKEGFTRNGFALEDADGGVRGRRDRFILSAEPGLLRWELPLKPDDPDRLIASPTVMTTEHMATWFPPGSGEERKETFTLAFSYTGKPARVDFLTRQLFDLSTRGSWTVEAAPVWPPDGGEAPAHLHFALLDRATGARLGCTREGERVSLSYQLVTFERPGF